MSEMYGDASKTKRKASSRRRHGSCTHTHMTRLFDIYDCDRCQICHNRPSFGWLYRCTQDSGGHLPACDFDGSEPVLVNTYEDARLYSLSPYLAKAIEEDRYTDDQIELLIAQKEHVRKVILSDLSRAGSTSSKTAATFSSLPGSITFSTVPTTIEKEDFDTLSEQQHKSGYEDDHGADKQSWLQKILLTATNQRPLLSCKYKICQTCRPVYRERAWGSIDLILNTIYDPPPKYEFENRRVSDVNTVKRLGTLKFGYRHYAMSQWELEHRNSRSELQKSQLQPRMSQTFPGFPQSNNGKQLTAHSPDSYDYAAKYEIESSRSDSENSSRTSLPHLPKSYGDSAQMEWDKMTGEGHDEMLTRLQQTNHNNLLDSVDTINHCQESDQTPFEPRVLTKAFHIKEQQYLPEREAEEIAQYSRGSDYRVSRGRFEID